MNDNDEMLDGKDHLAEEVLEMELEEIAENDPDIIELAKCEFVVLRVMLLSIHPEYLLKGVKKNSGMRGSSPS